MMNIFAIVMSMLIVFISQIFLYITNNEVVAFMYMNLIALFTMPFISTYTKSFSNVTQILISLSLLVFPTALYVSSPMFVLTKNVMITAHGQEMYRDLIIGEVLYVGYVFLILCVAVNMIFKEKLE